MVKVAQRDSYSSEDPLTELECFNGNLDFDGAQEKPG